MSTPRLRRALLALLLPALLPLDARGEGCGVINLSGNQAGCPGDRVVFNLLAVCDNCNCGAPPNTPTLPLPVPFQVTPFDINSDPALPDWNAGFFNIAPVWTVAGGCTPAIPVTCTPPLLWGVGMQFAILQVWVDIPFGATPGQTDSHDVDLTFGPGAIYPGPHRVTITTTVLPAASCSGARNDLCATALALPEGIFPGLSNVGAATDPPAFPCGWNAGPDVWFSHTARTDGTLEIETCSPRTNFDTVLEAFRGPCGNLVPYVCNDDWCSSLSSRVILRVQAAETVYFRVGGYARATGTFELRITLRPGGTGGVLRIGSGGCAGLDLQSTGTPNIGEHVRFELVGYRGAFQLLWASNRPATSIPMCPACLLEVVPDLVLSTNTIDTVLPQDPAMIDLSLLLQGADVLGTIGGCVGGGIDFTLSPTLRVRVGL